LLDIGPVAEAVKHDMHAGCGECASDAQSDAARRPSNDCGLAGKLMRGTGNGCLFDMSLLHDGPLRLADVTGSLRTSYWHSQCTGNARWVAFRCAAPMVGFDNCSLSDR